MTLILRPYAGETDCQAIAELIQSDPVFHHPVDILWRLCSTSLEDYRNAAVWEDETGYLQAFAALQFPWLTVAWRRTLHAPLYNPDLDLVAVAPDGRLAGFCIWRYQPALKTAQIEPLGVHPDFQQLVLSQALMAEGFQRAAYGAETARVETYSFSQPALKAYEAAGFQVLSQEFKYYKEYQTMGVF